MLTKIKNQEKSINYKGLTLTETKIWNFILESLSL